MRSIGPFSFGERTAVSSSVSQGLNATSETEVGGSSAYKTLGSAGVSLDELW